MDLASEKHTVVVLTAQGDRLLRFSIPHSRAGLEELLRRIRSIRSAPQGRPIVAFEATGHVWGAVAYWLREAQIEYRVVNPLTAHRIRQPDVTLLQVQVRMAQPAPENLYHHGARVRRRVREVAQDEGTAELDHLVGSHL